MGKRARRQRELRHKLHPVAEQSVLSPGFWRSLERSKQTIRGAWILVEMNHHTGDIEFIDA